MRKRINCFAAAMLASTIVHAAEAPTQALISDNVVKIGVLTDMSGVYSDTTGKGSVVSARMAIDDFGGKVAGVPIVLVAADHQNKVDVGATIARQWLDQQHVDVILDVVNSAVALAVQYIVRERDKVVLFSGAGAELTGKACSPNGIQWTYDTYSYAHALANGLLDRGGDTWFFITADYALGKELENEATAEIVRRGGKVLGSVRHPLGTADFSSFLLQAQASGAKVVALANAGTDSVNAVKQAYEFGLVGSGQKLAALLMTAAETAKIPLSVTGGMIQVTAFTSIRDDASRDFAARFQAIHGAPPNPGQAGVYSAVMHYLQAITAIGTDAAGPVIKRMKETPIHDAFAPNGMIREDGRMVHDIYLTEVKTASESNNRWDLYKMAATVPGKTAFRPMSDGGCPFVSK